MSNNKPLSLAGGDVVLMDQTCGVMLTMRTAPSPSVMMMTAAGAGAPFAALVSMQLSVDDLRAIRGWIDDLLAPPQAAP